MSGTAISHRQECEVASGSTTIRIVLLRHAQAGLHGCFCGHSNPGLSAEGREQIPAIIESLSRVLPTAIWSSDLRRATETAEPVAKHFGLGYTTSAALREINFGAWEELTWREVELHYPEDARAWIELFPRHRPPGGESFAELQARAAGQLEVLTSHAKPGCTLVVTHAGFIRAAIGWVLGMPDKRISAIGQDYGAITILERVRNHWSVAALNLSASAFSATMLSQTGERQP
ncbi:MAG TPA: histidine phosphatase family protein [Candidatus Dormibacteraeota bacterium]|nr:histidine phosphatase family protein [Candidatus Dormibacteraeota bacterium]